jgi:ankyrin repeat protein
MKKTIILGIALITFSSVATASIVETTSNGINENYFNSTSTPLCVAISRGELDIVKKFVEYGADVNEKSNGMTPLMVAARYNKVEIIKFLLEHGAKLNEKDEKGFTTLKYAELSSANEAILVLK